ncbi:MAG TPA: histidine kinase dimerization/phosphoacceptor domain-containing protein [Bryobacteraceae bacterium]|nr:histidine kinase dimerization/phosphoacceptor domain-containing protein [Bryobacteraceae bacterium]
MAEPPRARGRKRREADGCATIDKAWIARTLHNEVGQVLTAAGLQLELLRMDFEERAPEIAARTAAIQEMLDHALDSIRGVVSRVAPAPLKEPGPVRQKSE